MPTHTLGFRGQAVLPRHLVATAGHYGFSIHNLGRGKYRLEQDGEAIDVEKFAPSYISHEKGVMDLGNLESFLAWLHQPSAEFFLRHFKKDSQDVKPREILKQRRALHSFLNMATTGSAEISVPCREDVCKETSSCHAGTEDAMQDADEWRLEREFGNNNHVISALPHSGIDTESGFTLKLKNDFLKSAEGQSQQKARNLFWQALNTSTDNRYTQHEDQIILTGQELELFFREVAQHDIESLVRNVKFEEDVQHKLKHVQQKSGRLALEDAVRHQYTPLDRKASLETLLKSTSALVPAVNNDVLRDVWWREHFTSSWFADKDQDTPMADLADDLAVFGAVLKIYLDKDVVTPAESEALMQEFYPTLITAGKIVERLEQSAQKSGRAVSADILDFKSAFENTDIPDVKIAEKYLPHDQKDVLETLDTALENDFKSAAKSLTIGPVKGAAVSFWDFTKDVFNYVREDTKQAALVVGIGAALFTFSGSKFISPETLAQNDVGLIVGGDGIQEFTPGDELPREALQTQNYHIDIGFNPLRSVAGFISGGLVSPYYAYKHFTNLFMVEGTEWALNVVNQSVNQAAEFLGMPGSEDAAFLRGGKAVLYPLASFYFGANLFQNFSHVGFWGWAYKKGYKYGARGALRIAELSSPLTDPIYSGGTRLLMLARLKKSRSLSERLLEIAGQKDPVGADIADPEARMEFGPDGTAVAALGQAALTRNLLKDEVSEKRLSVSGRLRLGGIKGAGALKREFNISSGNITQVERALAKFDYVLENMASKVGIEDPYYQRYLKDNIDTVTQALQDVKSGGSLSKFDKQANRALQNVMAAEIRHFDSSPLWQALYAHAPDQKASRRLRSEANQVYGALKRRHKISSHHEKIERHDLALSGHVKENTAILGNRIWGGIVGAARGMQKLNHVVPLKPAAIGTFGILAGASAMDMLGYGNGATDILAATGGMAFSTTVLSTIFAGYNWFIDDVLFVHLGTGIGLMLGGLATRTAVKAVRPVVAGAAEKVRPLTQPTLGRAWSAAANFTSKGTQALSRKVIQLDEVLGKRLSERQRLKQPKSDKANDTLEVVI